MPRHHTPRARPWSTTALALVLLVLIPTPAHASNVDPVGLVFRGPGTSDGYTLYGPLNTSDTYLIDMDGQVVHQWPNTARPGNSVYLLPNGRLLRTEKSDRAVFGGGRGRGGVIEEVAWDGDVTWRYTYANRRHLQHHDIEPLPNGNILLLAWERHTRRDAIAMGRDPALLTGKDFWSETIIEVDRVTNQIVWRWRTWDHLVQDLDPKKPNYGAISDHPRRVDLNFPGGPRDWLHANSIAYNPELDQILLSLRRPSEIWVIDHALSTRQARGAAGDLLFRWGNPVVSQGGTPADRQLFDQHDAHWIPPGSPGAGQILVFNNGDLGVREYSSVDQIAPVMTGNRYAIGLDGSFLPPARTRVFPLTDDDRWWSPAISGAQRLPNGNTLIVDGPVGRLFEVTADGNKVWEYVNPFFPTGAEAGTNHRGTPIVQWRVFRAQRYPPDHPGLRRLTIDPAHRDQASGNS